MHKIFVYGTLKRGHGNNVLLRNAKFLGPARTTQNYKLTGQGIPFLWHGNAVVIGEVYEVDDDTLRDVDGLEGHPRWYKRQPIDLEEDFGSQVEAYFLDTAGGSEYSGDVHEYPYHY